MGRPRHILLSIGLIIAFLVLLGTLWLGMWWVRLSPLPVQMDSLQTRWTGLGASVRMARLGIGDAEKGPKVAEIEALLEWASLWRGQPKGHIRLRGLELHLHRHPDGRIDVEGWPSWPDTVVMGKTPDLSMWRQAAFWKHLTGQHVRIEDSRLIWSGAHQPGQEEIWEGVSFILGMDGERLTFDLQANSIGRDAPEKGFITVRGHVAYPHEGPFSSAFKGSLTWEADGINAAFWGPWFLPLTGSSANSEGLVDTQGRLEFETALAWTIQGQARWRAGRIAWPSHEAPPVDLAFANAELIFTGSGEGPHTRLQVNRLGVDDLAISWPTLFPEGSWPLAKLALQAVLEHGPTTPHRIQVDALSIESADLRVNAQGRYEPQRGYVDIELQLEEADARAVWRYLPAVVNAETRTWLRESLLRGKAHSGRVQLRGLLADFPFENAEEGAFSVDYAVSGVDLRYASEWPAIRGIEGRMRFEGLGMWIFADHARTTGVGLKSVRVYLPDLSADEQSLFIHGHAQGPGAGFLDFVDKSPVSALIHHATEGMKAEGPAWLDLRLYLPLATLEQTQVEGVLRLNGNRLHLLEDVPLVENARGELHFDTQSLRIPWANGTFLGGEVDVWAGPLETGALRFWMEGKATSKAARAHWPDHPWLSALTGEVTWSGIFDVDQENRRLQITSPLQGLTIGLPHPFEKTAHEHWPLSVSLDWPLSGESQLHVLWPPLLEASLRLPTSGPPLAGHVRLGPVAALQTHPVPASNLADPMSLIFSVALPFLDAQEWHTFITDRATPAPRTKAHDPLDAKPSDLAETRTPLLPSLHWPWPLALKGHLDAVHWGAYRFEDLTLKAQHQGENGQVHIRGPQTQGHLRWALPALGARLEGDFERVHLLSSSEKPNRIPVVRPFQVFASTTAWPALSFVIENTVLDAKPLGRFELQAGPTDAGFTLERIALLGPHGDFKAHSWPAHGKEGKPIHTLQFRLDSHNTGEWLADWGYPDILKQAPGHIEGEIRWSDPYGTGDTPMLKGRVGLQLGTGQFRQLDPGIGRLLGALSLQALPRRLALDFRDILREGFLFDEIRGELTLEGPFVRTETLMIHSPAAHIRARGEIDWKARTQDVHVVVQPTLSDAVAFGAAAGLIQPWTALVVYLIQKLMGDPLEQLFSVERHFQGPWESLEEAPPGPSFPAQGEALVPPSFLLHE
jgi:uncharacterized protein (TIGR02099 family)